MLHSLNWINQTGSDRPAFVFADSPPLGVGDLPSIDSPPRRTRKRWPPGCGGPLSNLHRAAPDNWWGAGTVDGGLIV